ncbi:MAG: fibronectin type III domain-containing protein, partial [Clostridia bacterium]|nr:fibronectin type III domain-containing protein [Clostridia bacterium]
GKIVTKCSECGEVLSTQTIAKIGSVTLSKENYIYDGKNKTPTVTVKDANGKKLVKNVDYKLSVTSSRSGIGRYTVKVTFIGNYSGTKNVYFYIKPGKTDSVKSASQTTSAIKLSWNAVPGAAGYTVYRYSPAKKAYVKAGTTSGTSLTVKSLYAGTKYTFKVVAYGKTSAGKVYDSDSYTLLKTATKTKTPELTKVTSSAKGKATLTHTDVSGETGYTVYYSTSKDSGFKKYNNFKADTKTCSITGLTSGKTYYFKVRTYITTDSGYVYSAWSAVKSVKVK